MSVHDINTNRQFFTHIKEAAEQMPDKSAYVEGTIEGLEKLFENRESIASVGNENLRNKTIMNFTKLLAEPGFCMGKTDNERMANIIEKIDLLRTSFEYAESHNDLDDYFKNGFIGDPCFNGRMITLTEYTAIHQ